MPYATSSDLDDYFGTAEVLIAADRDGDGSADTDVISTGLTAATEEIDSYLAVRYDLPLAATPGVLTRICCDLAMYHMSVLGASMTEDKETRYNNSVKWLRDVSKGVAALGPEEEEVVVQDDSEVTVDSDDRLFTRAKMAGLF